HFFSCRSLLSSLRCIRFFRDPRFRRLAMRSLALRLGPAAAIVAVFALTSPSEARKPISFGIVSKPIPIQLAEYGAGYLYGNPGHYYFITPGCRFYPLDQGDLKLVYAFLHPKPVHHPSQRPSSTGSSTGSTAPASG